MEDERSKSSYNTMQIERYHGARPGPYDLRSYSTGPAYAQTQMDYNKDLKFKRGKSRSESSSSKNWSFGDPAEFQRKKRVASYKAYAVEGKMKGSFRKSFRWLKDKYTQVLYGWW